MVMRFPGVAVVLLGIVGAFIAFGVYYPSSDDMALVPRMYRWDDPGLFANDIALGGTLQRFMFVLFVLHGLSKIMPLQYVTGLWIVCSHASLLLGLWLIFKVLADEAEEKKGIIVLLALLMICGRYAIIGSYHLQYYYWAPHYLAHPLIFIALFCLVTRRFWAMTGFLLAAGCIHALIGLQGAILCGNVLLVNRIVKLQKMRRVVVIVGIFLCLVFICLAVRSLDFSYVRISAFVRAPWHMAPLFDPAALIKYAIVAIGFMLMGATLCRSKERNRSIFIAGLIAIFGILFGIWNNTAFAIPAFVMANPLELGPTLHGLFLCLAALLIVRIAQSNMSFLVALPLLAPHKIGFFFIISVLAVYQLVMDSGIVKRGIFRIWVAIGAFLCAGGGSWMLFSDALSPWQSGAHYGYAVAVFVILLMHHAWLRGSSSVAVIAPAIIVIFYIAYGLTGGQCFWKINLAEQPAEPVLIDVAKFIENHSPKNSLIVHPPSIANFQYLSRRSSFVSFKAVPLAPNLLPVWLNRLQELGVYSKKMDYQTLTEPVIYNFENYHDLSGADFVNLAAKYPGITHIVLDTRHGRRPFLKTIYENAYYQVCVPVEQEKHLLAETAFPIALSPSPVSCDELLGSDADRHGWANRGFRGTIWLNRAESEIATLRLVAGKPDQKGEHTLLLSPKAESETGFPVVSGGQVVTFGCDMRYVGTTKSGGGVQLRLDVFSSQDGWSYYPRKIDVGKDWSNFEAVVSIATTAVSVYPTVIWDPAAEGCVLELRAPVLRWIKVVDTAPATLPADAGRSDGKHDYNSVALLDRPDDGFDFKVASHCGCAIFSTETVR